MLEYRLKHKDGHCLWTETAIRFLWDGQEFQGLVASSLEIKERMQHRQDLMEALTFSTRLVGLAADLEQTNDPDQVISLALTHCTEVVQLDFGVYVHHTEQGFLPGEMRGMHLPDVHLLIQNHLEQKRPFMCTLKGLRGWGKACFKLNGLRVELR